MRRSWPRFTLGRSMAATAVIALALADARLATVLLLAAGCGIALWSLGAGRRDGRSRGRAVAYLATLACLYLPFAWVLGDYPWDGYRWHWIRLAPVLPGLPAGLVAHPNDRLENLVAGAATVLLVAAFTAWGSSGRKGLVAACGVALAAACAESWIAYQLFLW